MFVWEKARWIATRKKGIVDSKKKTEKKEQRKYVSEKLPKSKHETVNIATERSNNKWKRKTLLFK